MPRSRAFLLLLAATLAASCGGSGSGSSEAPPSVVARFDVSTDAPTDFGAAPFPSDLYRDGAGVIRIGAVPTAYSDTPLFEALRDLFASRDGFCASCNVYFPIDGGIDRGSLPADGGTGDLGEPSPEDAVVLADVDPASPERGRLFPLRVEWDPERGLLAIRPVRGIALHRSRRYAAALTTSLRANDGSAVGASDLFREARDLRSPERASDALVAHVATAIQPALDELERAGVDRRSVIALAAYTTEDVTADLLATRAAVQGGPPLDVRIDRVRTGSEIDELLGVPSEDRPGIDVPPEAGTDGSRSIVHGAIGEVITGTFAAPRVIEGAGTDVGLARRDASGAIEAGPREDVPFVLTIPAGADRSRLPIAVAHHGFNASRVTGFATANTAARVGVAVLAIDAFQHGDRARSARDERNAIRDLPGPDGFAETEAADVSARVFGLSGTAPDLAFFTGYPLATFLQFAADVVSAVRAAREGGLGAAVGDAVGSPTGFDPERIGYIGNSLGAVVGVSALVMEPDLRAAVQNVQPGSIVETLAESTEFRPLVEALFLPRLGVEGPFDEVERHLILDPIVDLTRWVLEPIDPLALAPYLFRDPVHGGPSAEVLFQTASLDEVAATLATDSMLAASGAPRATVWDPAAHGMLEVLHQGSRYEPPAAPPFRLRPEPIPVDNPIAGVHLEIEELLRDFLASP
ncbi:MAG: hypothetical protein FJ144_17345 [Deltaproteobacteria bacterium]|nr:hypothetical protein [Deltaproteobacteria bacterium]